MSSVKTQSRYDASRHINYISTAAFNSAFFAYTFTGPSAANNFTGSGALSAVVNSSGTAVTAADCPAGRVLRTNGKRLYPDAAGIPVASLADRTPLIGVFDYHTNLSGFINPNATVFALYNLDKPVDDIGGTAAGSTNNTRGMSVYTGGDVVLLGNLVQSRSVNNITDGTSMAITAAQLVAGIVTSTPTTTRNIALPAAADIIALIGATVGATIQFTFINLSATAGNIATLTGATIIGSAATAGGPVSSRWIVRVDTSTTVVVYRA